MAVGEPGHGEAGEVALHVGDEGRDAGGRKPFDDALQGDGLAGAGRAGDQAVAVGALELELLRIAAAGRLPMKMPVVGSLAMRRVPR